MDYIICLLYVFGLEVVLSNEKKTQRGEKEMKPSCDWGFWISLIIWGGLIILAIIVLINIIIFILR